MTANTRRKSLQGLVFATFYGLIIGVVVIDWLDPIRSVLLSVWAGGVVLTTCYVIRRVRRTYETHWFDSTRYISEQKKIWDEITALMSVEPLTFKSKPRYPYLKWVPDFLALMILALFFLSTLVLIFWGDLDGLRSKGMAVWALPVGVLALIGTVLTVFYQVRLKARTDNRKEWIGQIRGKMTGLTAGSDNDNESAADRKGTPEEQIAELELLLNPGEPLHRTFLALARALHGIEDGFDDYAKSAMPAIFPKDSETGDPIPVSPKIWKARCIRISNVILKSEWERVKHAE